MMFPGRLTRCWAILFVTIVPIVLGVHPVAAQTDTSGVYFYELDKTSDFQTGCFAPCLCPVLISGPLQGTFNLKHLGFDGLYNRYDVSDVRWKVPDNTTNLTIQGGGTYRVGGEFAIQQQLSLDLS